jgi:hypothetical protein
MQAEPGMETPLLRSGVILAGFKTWLKGGSLPAEAEDGLLTAPLPRGRFGAGFAGDGVGGVVGLRDGPGRSADGRGRVRFAAGERGWRGRRRW